MKKLAIASAIAASVAAPCFAADQIGAAMMAFDNQFISLIRSAIDKQATESKLTVQFEDAQMDVVRQADQVKNLINGNNKGIIVNPIDATATKAITAAAQKAKIPLVYVNNKPTEPLPATGVAFVGSDEREAGKLQMQEVCRLLKGKGKLMILMGGLSFQQTRFRTEAAEEVLKTPECSGINVEDKQAGDWSRISGNNIVSNWITAGLKPDAIIANNDEMALGAIQALDAAKIPVGVGKDKVVVAGIDATQDALASIKDGKMAASVFQDAKGQGAGAVIAIDKMIKGQPVKPEIFIPFELVTPANADSYANRY